MAKSAWEDACNGPKHEKPRLTSILVYRTEDLCHCSEIAKLAAFEKWGLALKRFLVVAVGLLALAGCISTQEMPLAPNMVRIDTQSKGLLFTGQTVPQTMRAAANATLSRGYTHFRFADANLGQGSVVAGTVGSYNASYNGTYGRGFYNGSASGFGSTTVVNAPTANAAATVIMFYANDPEAKSAFRAEDILRQYTQ